MIDFKIKHQLTRDQVRIVAVALDALDIPHERELVVLCTVAILKELQVKLLKKLMVPSPKYLIKMTVPEACSFNLMYRLGMYLPGQYEAATVSTIANHNDQQLHSVKFAKHFVTNDTRLIS